KRTSAFTATEVIRARQIGDFVTPVVHAERWARAVDELRKRLQHYKLIAEGKPQAFIAGVARQIDDILSPLGTLVTFHFGFEVLWALQAPGIAFDHTSDDRPVDAIEDHFRRVINGMNEEALLTHLLLDGESIGSILMSAGRHRDPVDRPSLTQDQRQLDAVAALVKDAILDLLRKRFSGIVHALNNQLNAAETTSESQWLRCIGDALREGGVRLVVVVPHTSGISYDRQTHQELLRYELGLPELHGGYTIYQCAATPEHEACSVAQVTLPSVGENLFIAIPRVEFGRELDSELPWKLFIDRFAAAADAALSRIRHREIENTAIQVEITELLVHELRSPANEFNLTTQVVSRALALDPRDEIQELLDSLGNSARTFMKLAEVILDPLQRDPRPHYPVCEVMKNVAAFFRPRLSAHAIELTLPAPDDTSSIRIPFHIAYVVLVSMVRNSREAIVPRSGRITLNTDRSAEHVLLHVDDTGCGIPPNLADRVFEDRFTTKREGSGRGLYLARKILRRHYGDIVLNAAPEGFATRFTISFPTEAS
ncbi:MAG TPA: HAMP domain-containing sensor histidine kinase, partial [Thermoanaerobaculia bacterium]|nr:HAMP domain-containing sensor histidine kinase [Thermoanaerobaculia bacterium]